MITEKQKQAIMNLLARKEYRMSLCVSAYEYLDINDSFTDFNCQHSEGKKLYLEVISNVVKLDAAAKVYVEIYDIEKDEIPVITAETLWLETALLLEDIEEIFDNLNTKYQCYCTPSGIGLVSLEEINKSILVDKSGCLIEMSKVARIKDMRRLIYCWWD